MSRHSKTPSSLVNSRADQKPTIIIKKEPNFCMQPMDPNASQYEIPVFAADKRNAVSSPASPNISTDSVLTDSVSSQHSLSTESKAMTVSFFDANKKYYQQPAEQFYNDIFNVLPYDEKVKLQSLLTQLDQRSSSVDQESLIQLMGMAGFQLTPAAPKQRLYEVPQAETTIDDAYYAEPDFPGSKSIRQPAILSQQSSVDIIGIRLTETEEGRHFGFDEDANNDNAEGYLQVGHEEETYAIATDRTERDQLYGDALPLPLTKKPVIAEDSPVYEAADDRTKRDELYGELGGGVVQKGNETTEGDDTYAIATDRTDRDPLYGDALALPLTKKQVMTEENPVYAAADDRTERDALYGEMYETIPDRSKRLPEPLPRQQAPKVPARHYSIVKNSDDVMTEAEDHDLLLAADETLPKAQQKLIEDILNLIKKTPIVEEQKQQVVIDMTIDKAAVTRRGNIVRRNLHIIIPAAIVVGGVAGFLAYWFSKTATSEAADGDLAICRNALHYAMNSNFQAVNGLFSVTGDQAGEVCSAASVPATEDCLSFLTNRCNQLLSSQASSAGGATQSPYFGFFEAVSTMVSTTASTLASTASTVASTAASTVASTASTLASTASTAASTLASTASTAASTLASTASTVASTAASTVASTASTLASTASTAASTATTMATEALTTLATTASTAASTASTMATEALTTAASTLTSAASTTASTIASTTSTILSTISSTTSSIWSTTTSTLFQATSTATTTTPCVPARFRPCP